jgi:hypothetical protein
MLACLNVDKKENIPEVHTLISGADDHHVAAADIQRTCKQAGS